MEHTKSNKRVFTGRVVSAKMEKTVVVETERTFVDSQLHKVRRTTKNYKVHDEQKQAKLGDVIEFVEGRPVSKTKYMYLSRIVNKTI